MANFPYWIGLRFGKRWLATIERDEMEGERGGYESENENEKEGEVSNQSMK